MVMWAKITTRFSGKHFWPDATGNYEFLKNLHRHLFYVTVWIEQFHNDRDVEYIQFKDWLDGEFGNVNFKHGSCEMIAEDLARKIRTVWGAVWGVERRLKIEITEDGENGAVLEL